MAIRKIRLPRPEAGAERDVLWVTNHGCPQGKALRSSMGESVDEVHFPIGLIGWEMPLNVPFEVPASHECGACGAWLRILAEWGGPRLWTPWRRLRGRFTHAVR